MRPDSRLSKGRGGENREDSLTFVQSPLNGQNPDSTDCGVRAVTLVWQGKCSRVMVRRQCEYDACQLGHLPGNVSEEHSIEM